MKLVVSGQRSLAILGIKPNQSLFNLNFLFAVFINATNVGGNWLYLIHEANTFVEYANSIFITITITMPAVCVLILAFEKSLIFTSLGLCEQLVEKRENNKWNILCKSELSNCKNSNFSGMKTPTQRSMYEEPNRVAEKWSKLGYIGFAIITPIMFVFPKAILVYFIYYTTDAGRDAFDLPFLMWLVVHRIDLSIGNFYNWNL